MKSYSVLDGVPVKNGKLSDIIEVKPKGRSLTKEQRQIQKAVQNGKPIKLSGPNAQKIPGLPKDGIVNFDNYKIERY